MVRLCGLAQSDRLAHRCGRFGVLGEEEEEEGWLSMERKKRAGQT